MLFDLLTNVADKTRTEPVGTMALYALLGFAVVFVGIAFLIFIVWAVGQIMKQTGKTEKKSEKKEEIKAEKVEKKTEIDEIDEETLAVITAALMAYYQKNNPKCEFIVKRIKRI